MISKIFCPKCKSEDVDVSVSPFGQYISKCRDCDYEANTFPEKYTPKNKDDIKKDMIKLGLNIKQRSKKCHPNK